MSKIEEHLEKGKATVFTKETCKFCKLAKNILVDSKIPTTEIKLEDEKNKELSEPLKELTRLHTVPQIFFGTTFIGGYDELKYWKNRNFLTELIK